MRAPARTHSQVAIDFDLRTQEFIEYIRRGQRSKALLYAQRAFPPHSATHLDEIQRLMACLAYDAATEHPRYKPLFASARLDWLVQRFVAAATRVNGLPVRCAAALAALTLPTGAAAAAHLHHDWPRHAQVERVRQRARHQRQLPDVHRAAAQPGGRAAGRAASTVVHWCGS